MADHSTAQAHVTTLGDMLKASQWASGLTAGELARVERGVFEKRIPAGDFVCRKGEPVEHWLGVIDGLLKLTCDLASGKTAALAGIPAGGWFGEGSLLKTEARRYDIIALRDSHIALMRRATFHWLLDHSIAFNRFLLTQLNERLGQFIGQIESDRLHDTDARIARSLTTLFNPVLYPGTGTRLKICQEEIGSLAGISRQRVNLSLKKLEQAGYLSVGYRGVNILDLDGLRRFGG